MPANYGRAPFDTTGYALRVSADGHPTWKIGGITLASAVLPSNGTGADLTLTLDQTLIRNGRKYLLLGTVMCRITASLADTLTIGGSPTGGTFTVTVGVNGGATQTTSAVAYNATGATLQTAIAALTNVGAGNVNVSGSAGGPYSIGFPATLGTVTVTSSGASLTGGTSPAATTVASSTTGTGGEFGPYDTTATDGRQTLTRGDCYILDETWLDTPVSAFPNQGTAHPAVFDGGYVDKVKLVLSTGQGANSLPSGYPAGPTLSNFLAAFPAINLVND